MHVPTLLGISVNVKLFSVQFSLCYCVSLALQRKRTNRLCVHVCVYASVSASIPYNCIVI